MILTKKGIWNVCVVDGKILIGNSSSIQIQGIGELDLIPNDFDRTYTCEVLYVVGLLCNLLLVHEFCKNGLWIEFDEYECTFWEIVSNEVVPIGSKDNGI